MAAAGVKNYFNGFKAEMKEGEPGWRRLDEGKEGGDPALQFSYTRARGSSRRR
jgi:hypothetical protein